MPNITQKLAALTKLSEEINQQIIHTPNRFDSFEETLEFLQIGEQSRFLYFIYNDLNKLFTEFLAEKDCESAVGLSLTDQQEFKERALKNTKSTRDHLIRQHKYLSPSKVDSYEIKDITETKIKIFLELNLDGLLSQLFAGKKLSIENKALENRFKQTEILTDYRENYSKLVISNRIYDMGSDEPQQCEFYQKVRSISEGLYVNRMKYDVGLCGEHTQLALVKIWKNKLLDIDDVVEMVRVNYINDGYFDDNHVFLVINRDPNSDLNDISTWGKNAIFFDSWKRSVFKAEDYLSHRFLDTKHHKIINSIKYTSNDFLKLFRNLSNDALYLQLTGHDGSEEIIPALIDEYQLISLDELRFPYTKKMLLQLLEEVKPKNFPINVNIFLTGNGSQLINTIAGFPEPTIVIDPAYANNLNDIENIEELKFALAQTLFSIKNHGIGVAEKISAKQQFELDNQALQLCGNAEAAIRYLRRAAILEKKLRVDELPTGVLKLFRYTDDFRIVPASYEQRIKNLMTLIAQDKSVLENEAQQTIDIGEISREVNSLKPRFFYATEFKQQNNILEKINFLKQNLQSLNEHELIPYELTALPSSRVREFCHLIEDLNINWNDTSQVKAIDDFVNVAINLKVPGFDRIYSAILHQEYKYYVMEPKVLKPLGVFKSCQEAITDFTQARDFDTAINAAKNFLQVYQHIENHFAESSISYRCIQHISHYKKLHNGTAPVGKDRFFGSMIGSQIPWLSFRESDISHIQDFFNWIEQDETGIIAKVLWILGINLHPNVLDKLPAELIEKTLNEKESAAIQVYLPTFLKRYHKDPIYLHLFILRYISEKHILKTQMFDSDLSFEDKFKRFYDDNFVALRHPCDQESENGKYKLNCDNAAVNFLLEKFTAVALHGSDEDKKVVKSFFLGREDHKDLPFLQKNQIVFGLSFNSLYYQFCFYQHHKNAKFKLFTNAESIQLRNLYGDFDSPPELLLTYFDLPFQDFTIDCLEAFLPKIKEHEIQSFNARELLIEHLNKYGPYPLFSPQTARLLKLVLTKFSIVQMRPRELLQKIQWTEPSTEQLSQLDPLDLIEIYRSYEQSFLFTSFAQQQHLGELIFDQVKKIISPTNLLNALEKLLSYPLGDIFLRNKVIDLWVATVKEINGCDDGSEDYLEKIKIIIQRIQENSTTRDTEIIFSKLANAINTQKNVSELMGIILEPEKYLIAANHLRAEQHKAALSSLAAITSFLSNHNDDQLAALNFISNPISFVTVNSFSTYLVDHQKAHKLLELLGSKEENQSNKSREELIALTSTSLNSFYHSFWDRSLTERAVLIDYLIIPASQVLTEEQIKAAYDKALNYAAEKLFPQANTQNSDHEFALAFLKAYLDTADKYTRSILLSGMLVVSNETAQQGQEVSVGKKLALLCEHMGPAYVKLAQAIHSHPATPEYIRKDLAHVKGRANPPHRWDLWRLLLEVLPDEEIANIKTVGKLLGSASYNLALEVELQDGNKAVLILLRENAEKMAEQGFAHLKAAFNACQHPRADKIRENVVMTLDEAQLLSHAEIDHHISEKQIEIANKMYQLPLSINVDNQNYTVLMMPTSTIKSGNGYRFIERMYGDEFNDLPETSTQEKTIKKAIASAVLIVELINILHGGVFDSDRHGNQLRGLTDEESHTIYLGLYDFGEMSLEPPSQIELQQFAKVVHEMTASFNFSNGFSSIQLDALLSKHIEQAVADKQPSRYLMRIRKGLLALQDFQKCLSNEEMLDIVLRLGQDHKEKIHPILRDELQHSIIKLNIAQKFYHGTQSIFNLFRKKTCTRSRQDSNSAENSAQINRLKFNRNNPKS